ncbi:cytochrome b5-like heme/steroid binding domain-containing protein [Fomitopsis serialis]|uniref:cytochrome b5-like heme/steroid binding domain-containing protein n=1 Tax=Fomitopsis serialis TaxID=139415 RepID=UPI002008D485|nr:cytochrome b5-like heme/steroid binding domain-containing protein [Neoantrodia serialis]KAH9928397.1 cytochrome b5-like heme/steroid binding domain-containing protein [Neoantrodia serialis]
MASYLRSWLYSQAPQSADRPTPAGPPAIVEDTQVPTISMEDDDDDSSTVHGDDTDDVPPSFPALNSVQRLGSQQPSSSAPRTLTDAQLMPPPPVPSLAVRQHGVPSGSSLAVPPTTTKAPLKPSAKRGKVALAPGHGPLDWANLKKSGQDLRGVDTLLRVTPSMLKEHRTRDDAWSAFNGKVYNITPYLPYHPGGEKELMRVAGRDGSKLFALTHAWVNLDYMLDVCLVGFLVPES